MVKWALVIAGFLGMVTLSMAGGFLGGVLSEKPLCVSLQTRLPEENMLHVDQMLGIPALVHRPNNRFIAPFSPSWKGLEVKYIRDIFLSKNPDMIYVPQNIDGRILLPWRTSENGSPGLYGIYPGNTLTLVDDCIYDLGLGMLFTKARLNGIGLEGYVPMEIIIGETEVDGNDLWAAQEIDRLLEGTTVTYKGLRLFAIDLPRDKRKIADLIELFRDPARYSELSAGQVGIHPVYAANQLLSLLFIAANGETPETERIRIIDSCKVFFENYVIPRRIRQTSDSVSWPYEFEWTTNWGVKLTPPWYSTYANASFGNAAAFMYRMTGDERYRSLAKEAIRYIGTAVEKGGGEYSVSGYRLPAEYVYDFFDTPNIRVLDGEMITVVYSFNTARLLGDFDILRVSLRHALSLAMQLPLFTQADGSLLFSLYVEEMPPHYRWSIWSALQALANITKDRRFHQAALSLAPHVPKEAQKEKGF